MVTILNRCTESTGKLYNVRYHPQREVHIPSETQICDRNATQLCYNQSVGSTVMEVNLIYLHGIQSSEMCS